jgi:virulence factor
MNQVDAVSICTPTHTHAKMVAQAFTLGTHVLVEKPLAANAIEASTLMGLQPPGVVGMVGHIERYNPAAIRLMADVENKRVFAAEFRRLSPATSSNYDVNVIFDLMIHDIDLALFMFGHPMRVTAEGWANTDGLAYVVANMHYYNGLNVTMIASRITHSKIREIAVHSAEGYWKANLVDNTVFRYNWAGGSFDGAYTDSVRQERRSVQPREALQTQLEYFRDAVVMGLKVATDFGAGYEAVSIAEAIEAAVIGGNE